MFYRCNWIHSQITVSKRVRRECGFFVTGRGQRGQAVCPANYPWQSMNVKRIIPDRISERPTFFYLPVITLCPARNKRENEVFGSIWIFSSHPLPSSSPFVQRTSILFALAITKAYESYSLRIHWNITAQKSGWVLVARHESRLINDKIPFENTRVPF